MACRYEDSDEIQNDFCEESDEIQPALLAEVAAHVRFYELSSLAGYFNMTDAQFQQTVEKTDSHRTQILAVLKFWAETTACKEGPVTVKRLITEIEIWLQKELIDSTVWDGLQQYVESEALPIQRNETAIEVNNMASGASGHTNSSGLPLVNSKSMTDLDQLSSTSNEPHNTPSLRAASHDCLSPKSPSPEPNLNLWQRIKFWFQGKRVITPKDIKLWSQISLSKRFHRFMSLDFLPPEKTQHYPLLENYIQLVWTKKRIGALGSREENLTGIYSIIQNHQKLAKTVLVEGEPGIGKTSSMALLALNWAESKEEMKAFDFVWLIQLKFVDKSSSLEKLIITQHQQLKGRKVPDWQIKSILESHQHKVLLIMDGYDEYSPGSNKEIDEAIQNKIGNYFLILTSRPEFLAAEFRQQIDDEIQIKGLSDEHIALCAENSLRSKQGSEVMLKQAKEQGTYEMLHIPIILLMTCVVFKQHGSLPQNTSQLMDNIFKMTIERSRNRNRKSRKILTKKKKVPTATLR